MLVYCYWSFKDLLATLQDIHKTSNKTRVFPAPTLATCCGFKGSKTNSFSSRCQKEWNKHLQNIIIVSMENYHRNLLCFQKFEGNIELLLMEEILHQLICSLYSLSHYLQGLYIPGGAGFLPSTVVSMDGILFLFTHIYIYIHLV